MCIQNGSKSDFSKYITFSNNLRWKQNYHNKSFVVIYSFREQNWQKYTRTVPMGTAIKYSICQIGLSLVKDALQLGTRQKAKTLKLMLRVTLFIAFV